MEREHSHDFLTIRAAIAVGVGDERIGAGDERIGAGGEFLRVRRAVAVGIAGAVRHRRMGSTKLTPGESAVTGVA